MKKSVIIVAGGIGTRMGKDIPKQFLLLKNKPVLMHTIERFYQCNPEITIVLVLPKDQISSWKLLIDEYHFLIDHQIVTGGETRFHSVKNGLDSLNITDGIVGIHDGVRPLVSLETINRCYSTAEKTGNAIPCIDIQESIRKISEDGSNSVNRSEFKIVQTPQVFHFDKLKKAYDLEYQEHFTDDASVIENSGEKITIVEGNRENIKITTPLDLKIAEVLMRF